VKVTFSPIFKFQQFPTQMQSLIYQISPLSRTFSKAIFDDFA